MIVSDAVRAGESWGVVVETTEAGHVVHVLGGDGIDTRRTYAESELRPMSSPLPTTLRGVREVPLTIAALLLYGQALVRDGAIERMQRRGV